MLTQLPILAKGCVCQPVPTHEVWQANPFTITATMWRDAPSLSGVESVTAEIRTSQTSTDAPLAAVTLTAPEYAGPFEFAFSSAEMNQAIATGETSVSVWLVIYAVLPDDELQTLYVARLEILRHNASLTAPSPPSASIALTLAQANALYATLSALSALDARVEALEEGGVGSGASEAYVDAGDDAVRAEFAASLASVVTVLPAADPTTDMRATIQTALDAAGALWLSTGITQRVQLGVGTYRVTTVDSPVSGTKAAGAYGLEIPSGVHFCGMGPATYIEIHAGGSFGTGVGISPAGMRSATTDYGAAEQVMLSDFSVAASGAGTDPSSGNLINLVHCQDWAIERVHIGQSYYHGVEIDQSRRIRFSHCHWTGPHAYAVSGSWIQLDNGDAGPRSTVPTGRLVSEILVENCSFSRPDTDTGPHGIELFHSLAMDMRDIVFRGCSFRGRARAFTQIFGIGAGITLASGQFLEGFTIEDCDVEMRHPQAWFINGLQSGGMTMRDVSILYNRFRGNSGQLIWLGGSSSAAYNATHADRTGLVVRGSRYHFAPTDWVSGVDFNFFVHIAWQSAVIEDNRVYCVGDMAGLGSDKCSMIKLFSNLDLQCTGNVITFAGTSPTPVSSRIMIWVDSQLTDAAGTTRRFVVEDNAAVVLSGGETWSYGILIQRGASAVTGCKTRVGGNYGKATALSTSHVLLTGYQEMLARVVDHSSLGYITIVADTGSWSVATVTPS